MTELVLHEACACGDYESLQEHLKTGKHDPNCRDEEWGGKAPLHWTAISGSIDCCRLLLTLPVVNGNIRMDNGWTPAHCAAESGRIYILRALHNANVRLDEKDPSGDTPLDVAKMYAQTECIQFLQDVHEEYVTGVNKSRVSSPAPSAKPQWKPKKKSATARTAT